MYTRGVSFIELIVSVAIILTVFVGLFAVLKLGVKMSTNNKARVSAVALAQERVEYIHSLNYDDIGTVGGIPSGNIPQIETVDLNGISFIRRTLIQFVDAPQDGLGAADENNLTADYKSVRVEVHWVRDGVSHKVVMNTTVSPVGVETVAGGGTLALSVFNALAQPIQGASVHIVNASTTPPIDVTTYTNNEGKVLFPGTPSASSFAITVTKDGMSTAQTYAMDATNTNPTPGHLTVTEAHTTSASFAIDTLGDIIVHSFDDIQEYAWEDIFSDTTKVSTTSSTTIASGEVALLQTDGEYATSGSVLSEKIMPTQLQAWKVFSWNDTEPTSTKITYHIFYDESNPQKIPESDLPGNDAGFEHSPIDISTLSTSTYPALFLQAELETTATTVTPTLSDWKVTYDAGPLSLGNQTFHMHGEKTIGSTSGGAPIYKKEIVVTTNINGETHLQNMEWDIYHFSLNDMTHDISRACAASPLNLAPGEHSVMDLYLLPHTANSLRVSVIDASGDALNDATVQLTRTGFDKSKVTKICGQAFFENLSAVNDYEITVSKAGYITKTISSVQVSGRSTLSVTLNQ